MPAELVVIEDGQKATLKPVNEKLGPWAEPIEPVEAANQAGETPTTDQGEGELPSKRPSRKWEPVSWVEISGCRVEA